MREALDLVMTHRVFGCQMDQWGLIPIGLAGLREINNRPDIITNSFRACNLMFSCRVGVDQWLVRIKRHLQSSAKFVDEGVITPSMLLPVWYTNVPANTRAKAAAIVDAGSWSDVETMQQVCTVMNLTPSDLTKHQQCYFAAKDTPPSENDALASATPPPREQVVNPNADLRSFNLIPPKFKHRQEQDEVQKKFLQARLFEHIVNVRNQNTEPLQPRHCVPGIDSLDLAMKTTCERSKLSGMWRTKSRQMALISPQQSDLTVGAIMREVGTETASIRMARRQLNVLGEVNACSVIANTPERIEKLKQIAMLASSIDSIKEHQRGEKANKATAQDDELRDKAPAGLKKLQSSGSTDPSKCSITVSEIRAVSLVYMFHSIKLEKKQFVMNAFNKKVEESGWALPAVQPAATTEPTAAGTTPDSTPA